MSALTNPLNYHRTTVTLESDTLDFLKTYAHAKAMKMSEAMNDIIRLAKGKNEARIVQKGSGWAFDLPPLKAGQAALSSAQVAQMLADSDADDGAN